MSTMTIERRRKLEDHIMYAYLFKHARIGHGSNGWDLIYGPVGDSPCIFAKPSLMGVGGGFEINWFIPNEHGNESQPYKLYITVGTNVSYSDSLYTEINVAKRELADAKDHIEELDKALADAASDIEEWKSNTCCETPTDARKHIEELMEENASLQASVHNLEFTKAIGKEFSLKGCSTRRAFWIRRNTDKYFKCVNRPLNHILFGDGSTTYGRSLEGIQKYLDKHGYSCVMDAIDQLEVESDELKENIRSLSNRNDRLGDTVTKNRSYILELQKEIADWQNATSCKVPKEAESRITNLLNDLGMYTLRIDSLKKRIAGWERSADYWGNKFAEWKNATECDTPEEAEKRINDLKEGKPAKYNKLWITSNGLLFSESDKTVDVLEAQLEEASKVISDWQNATGCKLPSMAKEKIEHYERRLGNAVQAASCAAKHLENITF